MTTLSEMMARFLILDVRERIGERDHPAIQWAHELCRMGEGVADEVPWCSSVINLAAALTDYRRSRSAAARSWLNPSLGTLITDRSKFRETLALLESVKEKNAVLIFRRGRGRGRLGADVLDAPGHVAVFESYDAANQWTVLAIGGNQGNTINIQRQPLEDLIGILVVVRA